ncbi:hypothetical protein [Teichococcus aestuarii]|uniref:hypothetical protein n=1 Tax=Teichococcus aestuarii TaxID=568898 RepID=UPI003608B82D
MVLGFATLAAAPGWSIAVSEAAAAYEASWRRPMQALAVGAALALLLGLALALWLGGRLLRPVRALTADAATVTRPGATPPLRAVPMAVAEFETLRRHLGAADATLRLQAAEARAGEARLRTAQAVGQLGVFEYDVARDRFWRSEEQQRLHGLDAGAPQPDLAGYLAQVHPQDRPGFARKIEAAFLGREGSPRSITSSASTASTPAPSAGSPWMRRSRSATARPAVPCGSMAPRATSPSTSERSLRWRPARSACGWPSRAPAWAAGISTSPAAGSSSRAMSS